MDKMKILENLLRKSLITKNDYQWAMLKEIELEQNKIIFNIKKNISQKFISYK